MKTYYQSNANIDNDFGRVSYTPPTILYLGLSTTPIARDGSGITEPSASTGYSRVAIQNTKTSFTNAVNGELSNSIDISFPESTGSWGTITYIFLSDAATGGNIRYYEALSSPRQVQPNSTIMFRQQTLKFSDQ